MAQSSSQIPGQDRSGASSAVDQDRNGTSAPKAAALASAPARDQPITSPVISPPYWPDDPPSANTGNGARSRASSRAAGQITLIDNTIDGEDDGVFGTGSGAGASRLAAAGSRLCWARSASIDGWTVIEGGFGALGSYVVFHCVIETTNGVKFTLNKRYSEFETLHANLLTTFPLSHAAIPPVPPKSAFYKFQNKFLSKRKDGLEFFLLNVICNPEFSSSPVLKDFLFA